MVDEIRVKAALLHLLLGERAGELMHDRADHLQMAQFLRANIGQKAFQLGIGHGIALTQVAEGSA